MWVLPPLYLASAILKGFAPHGSNMLGDTMPWFLPLFVFGLFAWVFYEAIEKYAKKKNTSFWLNVVLAVRWLPPVQLALMLIVRLIALIQRDGTHIEVARYMGSGGFSYSDLKLILTGDGGFESIVLVIVLFTLFSERLPSIANARSDLRQDFRNRMMMFTGLVLLLFSTKNIVLFCKYVTSQSNRNDSFLGYTCSSSSLYGINDVWGKTFCSFNVVFCWREFSNARP